MYACVKNVPLSYTTDNDTSWISIPMNYNATTGFYETVIPEQSTWTLMKYEIIAFDYANNKSIQNNSGECFVYTVIPEFTTTILLVLLFCITLILMARKRMTSNKS